MKVIDFIFAARPMLLLPVWSVYLITCGYVNGRQPMEFDTLVTLIGVTLVYIGAYFVNHIYDFESDSINKKLGYLQEGLIQRSEMMAGYVSVSTIGLAIVFAVSRKAGVILLPMILLGFMYSVPPFRLKDRPIWGLIANGMAYGLLLPLIVPGYLDLIELPRLYILAYFFLTVSAGYLLTIIPDREGDRKTGKITLAVLLPDKPIILLAITLLILSLGSAYALGHYFLALVSLVSIVLFLVAFVIGKETVILFACKVPIFLMSILAGYYYPAYLIFILVLLLLTRLYYRKRFGIAYPRLN